MYGGYLVYNMPVDKATDQLAVAIYSNMSSVASPTTFGSTMLQQIARYYSGNPSFYIEFENVPVEPSVVA